IRPLLPRADRAIVTLLLTFGVSLVLRDIAQVVWGTETHAVAPPFTGIVSFAEVFLPTYRLFVFGIALMAIFATWWLVYRTRLGAVLRATAVDPSMVASFGIPIRLVYGLTFIYGCGLAGLAGVLLSPIYAVFPTMGHDFLVMAFAVVIVGGMGSIIGAVVAAVLLAQVQGLASLWIPPVWAETLVYGVMLLVLVARPGGLFNRLGEAGCSNRTSRPSSRRRAPPLRREAPLHAAARVTVGDRLLQALYPPQSSAAQLRWVGFAMLALAAIFPWLGGPFYTRLAIESFLFGAIALSVDILLGYAGLLSLGQ